jgi:hypothetical protein
MEIQIHLPQKSCEKRGGALVEKLDKRMQTAEKAQEAPSGEPDFLGSGVLEAGQGGFESFYHLCQEFKRALPRFHI